MSDGRAEEFDYSAEADKVTHVEPTNEYRLVVRNGYPLLQRMYHLSCIKNGERVMICKWTTQDTIYETN
jgi:hypothetical protein